MHWGLDGQDGSGTLELQRIDRSLECASSLQESTGRKGGASSV